MLHYQLSMALTDLRIRDLVADARRDELIAEAKRRQRDRGESSSRLNAVSEQIARTVSLLNGRHGARAGSTVTSLSDAGPMGCSA